ncbi:MAG: T9SS type A sorting domain-containing protein [Rhodothermaceae bacterium]|nr:T9SS type A sorting domain-containing protein [Rhodothermaceae bacterium]
MWKIVFVGPSPNSWKSSAAISLTQPWIQAEDVFTIAAWDITVQAQGGAEKDGRFFAEHLPLSMGDPKAPLFLDLYVVTGDGYIYEVGYEGVESQSILLFSNRDGFVSSDQGVPLYHSVELDWANAANKSLPGGISLPVPLGDLSENGTINKLFFSPPAADLPGSITTQGGSIPLLIEPQLPGAPHSFAFSGSPGNSGTFSFQVNDKGRYRIEVDINGNGVWGDGSDVVLHTDADQGMNFVVWDGVDGEGNNVLPAEAGYEARIMHVVGEAHLPFIDVEENLYGIQVERLNGPGASRSAIYYDDGLLVEAGSNTATHRKREGTASETGAHPIMNNFGNSRGIDTWTYATSEPIGIEEPFFVLQTDLRLSLSAPFVTPGLGEVIDFDLNLRNDGPHGTSDIRVELGIPAGFEVDASSATAGTFDPATNTWTVQTLSESSEEHLTLSLYSNERGTFDIYAEVVDFQGLDIDSSPDNWDKLQSRVPGEDDEDLVQVYVDPLPSVGIAKRVVEKSGDASEFEARLEIVVENLGNTPLDDIQVVDLVPDAFQGTDYALSDVVVSDPLVVNTLFDGKTNTNLLSSSGNTLGVGEKATISYSINVIPFSSLGPYLSSAEVFASGPGNARINDLSIEGDVADPNGNGLSNDPGEDTPTQITIDQRPALGVALDVVDVSGGASSFSAQCKLYVENLGDVFLQDIQVNLDLENIFGQNRYDVTNVQVDSHLEINPAFNGSDKKSLILPGALGVRKKAIVSFQLNAYPVVPEDEYTLQVIGRAQSAGGAELLDFSDSGSNPDSNNNQEANDLGEGDPTVIVFEGDPVIGASLVAERVTGDLSGFTGYYTLVIKNLGDVPLYDIQAFNNLDDVFPGSEYTVLDVSTIYGIEANAEFNGRVFTNLIGGQDIPLYPGETFQLDYVVEVEPSTYFGPFNNTVLVKARTAEGTFTSDLSDSGTQIDADSDGNPDEEGENDFHELRFAPNAAVGAALAMSNVSGDLKQFNVSYTIFVENKSDVPLHNLSVEHVLDSTFADARVEILTMTTDSDLMLNTLFDGHTHSNLLKANSSSLEVGEAASISIEAQVNPRGDLGPYFVGATVKGETPFGTFVSDRSNEGTNTDPNGNGNPSDLGEDKPSLLSLLEKPVIGATFDVSEIEGDLTRFRARHIIRVENLGDVPLENVHAEFDLAALYPGAEVEVIRHTGRGPLPVNESFNGLDQAQLFDGSMILDVADTSRIEVDVIVQPEGYVGLYSGNIQVTASGPSGTSTFDVSDRGRIIDLNNNGLANEVGENRSTEIAPGKNPSIGVAQSVSRLEELADGSYELHYNYLIRNLGDVRLTEVRLIENLSDAFGTNNVFVESITVSEGGSLAVNEGFNGVSNTDLLDLSRSSLNPGEQATVFLALRTPASFGLTEIQSNSVVKAKGPDGSDVEDVSNDGVYIDPNGNGRAGDPNENVPTRIVFESQDALDFATWLTDVSGDHSNYSATFKAYISNLGQREMSNMQLVLDLTGNFGGLGVQIKNVSLSGAESIALNADYDGTASTNLFDSIHSSLLSGTSVHVVVDVAFSNTVSTGLDGISFEMEAENTQGERVYRKGALLPVHISTSTGEDAGLESDGDLAMLLAERSYRRKRGLAPIKLEARSQSYPFHMAGVDAVHGKGSLNAIENLELVPSIGPNNSEAIVKTPEDLYGVTNATSILAIDYIAEDHRVAGLFATTTPAGETYEHSKNICDRLQGGDLKHVEIVSIRGYPFVRSTLVQPTGEVDYAISFISYRNAVSHLIDSRFIRDEYIVDRVQSGEILNFQVWSYNPSFAEDIVAEIIDEMETTGHVDFYSREDDIPEVPATFVTSSRYENGSMYIMMKNTPGVTQYRFSGESSQVESGDKQVFDEVVTVPIEYREQDYIPLQLKSGSLFDALLYVSNDFNEDVDQVYISDGAWGQIIESSDKVEIEILDILDQGDFERVEDSFVIERGLHFKGNIKEQVVFFRQFKPGGMPADLSEFDYVSFEASGLGEVAMRLESMQQDAPVVEKSINLGPVPKTYSFRLSDFVDAASSQNSFRNDVATAIRFMFDTQIEDGVDVELLVQNIYFGKGQAVSGEDEALVPVSFALAQNFPNPFSNSTTLAFDVPEPAHVQISVYDLLGRKIFDVVDKEYATGKHNVRISSDDLASGMYFYKMVANDQVFTQTMHVVR